MKAASLLLLVFCMIAFAGLVASQTSVRAHQLMATCSSKKLDIA